MTAECFKTQVLVLLLLQLSLPWPWIFVTDRPHDARDRGQVLISSRGRDIGVTQSHKKAGPPAPLPWPRLHGDCAASPG